MKAKRFANRARTASDFGDEIVFVRGKEIAWAAAQDATSPELAKVLFKFTDGAYYLISGPRLHVAFHLSDAAMARVRAENRLRLRKGDRGPFFTGLNLRHLGHRRESSRRLAK